MSSIRFCKNIFDNLDNSDGPVSNDLTPVLSGKDLIDYIVSNDEEIIPLLISALRVKLENILSDPAKAFIQDQSSRIKDIEYNIKDLYSKVDELNSSLSRIEQLLYTLKYGN